MSFNHDKHNREISYRSADDSAHNKVDDFGVNKNVIGGNILCGRQLNYSNHFGFGVYRGIGFRVRNIHTVKESYNKNVDFYNHAIDINISDMILHNEANAGMDSGFNLTAGF